VLVADEQTDHRVTKPGRLMSDVPAMLADKRGLADVVFAQDQDQVFGGEAPARVSVKLGTLSGSAGAPPYPVPEVSVQRPRPSTGA
jgi:hypothetical protein